MVGGRAARGDSEFPKRGADTTSPPSTGRAAGVAGETGSGPSPSSGSIDPLPPAAMRDMLPPLALGVGRQAIKVAPGASYNCAILDNHRVKCWGVCGTQSALGYEDMNARGDGPGEMGDALPFVDLGSE